MRQHVASFANFVCRFGAEKVLLDYAEQIILPAFTDDKLIRSYGNTHFFFYEVKIVDLSKDGQEPILGIAGRYIKNTKLSREQIFDPEKGIVKDAASISSAPSVHFVLILNNHRLIYFPETSHAPDMKSFRATTEYFIKIKYKEFIDKEYKRMKAEGEKATKKSLFKLHPYPTLEIIPISGDDAIDNFVRRYDVLKKIEFKLINPNDEIDAGEMFDEIRNFLGPINPTSTRLETSNSAGFDVEKALPRIKSATETANQKIKLTGKDINGNTLKGDNHSFKISAPIGAIPATRTGLTKKLYQTFEGLLQAGSIKIGVMSEAVKEKITNLIDGL